MLIELKQAGGKMEPPGIRENMLEHKPRDPLSATAALDLGACLFHHLAEVNARGAGRFARAAIQTTEHMFGKCVRYAGAALVQCAH